MNKKANINTINLGLVGFIGLIMMILMVFFILSTLKTTPLICGGESTNASLTLYQGVCYRCAANATTGNLSLFNSSDTACHDANSQTLYGTTLLTEYNGTGYTATKDLQNAGLISAQMTSVIIIVLIVIGILSLLALIGYNVYQKMKN